MSFVIGSVAIVGMILRVMLERALRDRLMATIDHLILPVNDVAASLAFYVDVLGFTADGSRPPFTVVRVSADFVLQLAPWGTDGNVHLAFALARADFDAAFARIKAGGIPYGPSLSFGRHQHRTRRRGRRGTDRADPLLHRPEPPPDRDPHLRLVSPSRSIPRTPREELWAPLNDPAFWAGDPHPHFARLPARGAGRVEPRLRLLGARPPRRCHDGARATRRPSARRRAFSRWRSA